MATMLGGVEMLSIFSGILVRIGDKRGPPGP